MRETQVNITGLAERADPETVAVLHGQPGDLERHLRSDQLIRSGMCPNGHGLMQPLETWGQECPACHFVCNTLPEQPGGTHA